MLSAGKIVAFVPTTDFTRARAFYADLLGLEVVSEDDFALALEVSGTTVRVIKVETLDPAPYTILGWEVVNIRDVAATLARRGVVFTRYAWFEQDDLGIWTTPGGARVVWFKDPDGNVLSISQAAEPGAAGG
jgi:catechol 2,3-dioxygenase-like lactoylglutathione lyase family enzyme